MSCNVATIIGGPALVTYKGQTFYSKGDISISGAIEAFAIETSIHGQLEERESGAPVSVSFVPAGEWEALAVLWPYQAPIPGQSIVRVRDVDTVDTVNDELDIAAHPFRTEGPVRVFPVGVGVMPTGITAGQLYYARSVTADSISLHPTAADATADTNRVDITAAGTLPIRVVEQEPLVIHTLDGKVITFHVAAVTQQPDIAAATTETLIGQVTFECFRKAGEEATTDNSFWTITSAALSDTTFDPASIITQAYSGAWGGAVPWDDFSSKNGFRFSFPVNLAAIEDDACGVVGRRYVSGQATCTAQPTNVDESALLTKLGLQAAGAGRGRRLVGDNLNVSAAGVYIRLYGATLRSGPQQFSSQNDRIGDLNWAAARVFTAGVPSDLFYLGTAAPA